MYTRGARVELALHLDRGERAQCVDLLLHLGQRALPVRAPALDRRGGEDRVLGQAALTLDLDIAEAVRGARLHAVGDVGELLGVVEPHLARDLGAGVRSLGELLGERRLSLVVVPLVEALSELRQARIADQLLGVLGQLLAALDRDLADVQRLALLDHECHDRAAGLAVRVALPGRDLGVGFSRLFGGIAHVDDLGVVEAARPVPALDPLPVDLDDGGVQHWPLGPRPPK